MKINNLFDKRCNIKTIHQNKLTYENDVLLMDYIIHKEQILQNIYKTGTGSSVAR